MIYFDNAATTQMSEVAIEALIKVTKENYGNPSSNYSYGKKSKKILDKSRRMIAECIGAEPEEIYFTSGGTESDNWAVSQAINQCIDRIVTTQIEHHAILNPVCNAETKGMHTIYLPVDRGCLVKMDDFARTLCGERTFFSVMFQNNETGVIQPIERMSRVVHEDNPASIFHTDAVQAIGHTIIDVKKLGIDMMSASAHKFNGPKGVGFLYVRKGCTITPFIRGGGQEGKLRSGTENVASIYAMAKALEENVSQIDNHRIKVSNLEKMLINQLEEKGIEFIINGNEEQRAPGILSLSIKNIDGEGLLNMLDMHGICISIGSACNSKEKEKSHVLRSMAVPDETIEETIRISIGRYNTENDITRFVEYVQKFYELSRRIV